MLARLIAHEGFDHLENIGLVHPRAAYRARPLRDIGYDDHPPADRHPHLDPPLLVGPAAGAAAVACLPHCLPPSRRDGPVCYEPVDKTAPAAGKSGRRPGGHLRTPLPARARL